MGLGLYLTKRFVELHEGKIILESSPGKGSCFKVKLPVYKKSTPEGVLEETIKLRE
jgi:signal transduction histidine kinase